MITVSPEIWNTIVARRSKPITRIPGRMSSRRVPRSGKDSSDRQAASIGEPMKPATNWLSGRS
jgi:hypothetical protein